MDRARALHAGKVASACPAMESEKRRRVVPGSREATRDTRRAEGAKRGSQGSIRTRRPVIWETGV